MTPTLERTDGSSVVHSFAREQDTGLKQLEKRVFTKALVDMSRDGFFTTLEPGQENAPEDMNLQEQTIHNISYKTPDGKPYHAILTVDMFGLLVSCPFYALR